MHPPAITAFLSAAYLIEVVAQGEDSLQDLHKGRAVVQLGAGGLHDVQVLLQLQRSGQSRGTAGQSTACQGSHYLAAQRSLHPQREQRHGENYMCSLPPRQSIEESAIGGGCFGRATQQGRM